MNPLVWVQAHKKQAAIGGGALGAVGIGLYRRRKANAAAAGTTATVPPSATSAAGVSPSDSAAGAGYDPSAFDDPASMYLPQISQALTGLATSNAAILAATKARTTTAAKAPVTVKRPVPAKRPTTGGTLRKPAAAPKPRTAARVAAPTAAQIAEHTANVTAANKRLKLVRRRRPARRPVAGAAPLGTTKVATF